MDGSIDGILPGYANLAGTVRNTILYAHTRMESIKLFEVILKRQERKCDTATLVVEETHPLLYLHIDTARDLLVTLEKLVSLDDVYLDADIEEREWTLIESEIQLLRTQGYISKKSLQSVRS